MILVIIKILFILNNISFVVNTFNSTEHVCFSEKTYVELIRTPIKQPVKVRSYNWCLEFPPRCSNYKTEIRDVIKLENETRTQVVEHCCDGYAEIVVENETICKPICRGGCGRGYCSGPNECSCDVGYTGRHCTQRCRHGRWGDGCKNICKCRNGALCDNKIGKCRCNEGWIGDLCDQPCPNGYYGSMCKNMCECSSNRCDPLTGECTIEDSIIIFETTTTTNENHIIKVTNERIDAEQWIKIDMNNNTDDKIDNNSTSSIIESLNSTIANLTENIDKLAKNLNDTKMQMKSDQVAIIVPNPIIEMTTSETIQNVIVIKNPNPSVDKEPTVLITNKPEVIHLITNWQDSLHDIHLNGTKFSEQPSNGHEMNAVIIILVIFGIIILTSIIGFMIMYRRYLQKKHETDYTRNDEDIQEAVFSKPLPDLPGFTQNLTTNFVPEFYDSPTNNTAIKTSPYTYTTESLYSEPPKSNKRKESLEHLYDEIKYTTSIQ